MKTRAILWAINPAEKSTPLLQTTRSLALATAKALHHPVRPVFVAQESPVQIPGRKKLLELQIALKAGPEKSIEKPEVLFIDPEGATRAVSQLSQYASKIKSDFIVSSTSAKGGLLRFLRGSFAEALVSEATLPVILVNPKAKATKHIKRILFATDFSGSSLRAFRKLLPFAKNLGAQVEIFSVQLSLPAPAIPMDLGQGALYSTLPAFGTIASSKEERLRLESRGEIFLAIAREKKVRARLHIKKMRKDVAQEILSEGRKIGCDLIALSARSNTADTHIFGSVTQQVIRNSRVPVWTYHYASK